MDIAVVIATTGERRWIELACGRALPSVSTQTVPPTEVIPVHYPSGGIHEARNEGAHRARAEWLCFLDADDELHPDYLAAMSRASGDLRAPALQFVRGDHVDEPVTLSDRDIDILNPCAIGTLVRREMFLAVGGFWPWPAWEDWCLFRRCWLVGAELAHVPDAIYRAHVAQNGRNSAHTDNRNLHRSIRGRHRRWQKERAA